jgi:hypothetical protein
MTDHSSSRKRATLVEVAPALRVQARPPRPYTHLLLPHCCLPRTAPPLNHRWLFHGGVLSVRAAHRCLHQAVFATGPRDAPTHASSGEPIRAPVRGEPPQRRGSLGVEPIPAVKERTPGGVSFLPGRRQVTIVRNCLTVLLLPPTRSINVMHFARESILTPV